MAEGGRRRIVNYPSFDQYTKTESVIYRCYNCGRTFTASTHGKMDRESLPCPCGVQLDDLARVDPFLDPDSADAEETVTWDEVVEMIADSGFWRCDSCGFTAPGEDWEDPEARAEPFTVCPRCGQVEDYEILRIE